MKKKLFRATLAVAMVLVMSLCVVSFAACGEGKGSDVEFTQREYELYDGDSIAASGKNVTYAVAGNVDGVSVDEVTGMFSIDASVPDCRQVVALAKKNGEVKDTAVCLLHTPVEDPVITFSNITQNIVSGDTVTATSAPQYSVTYSLKEKYDGISIDSSTGRVTFTAAVEDLTKFTVVATAKNVSAEMTFTAVTGNYVTADSTYETCEYQSGETVSVTIVFGEGNEEFADAGVLSVSKGGVAYDNSAWQYYPDTFELKLLSGVTKSLPMGENTIEILTVKNSIKITIRAAIYLREAADIAAINDDVSSLSGCYVMANDIDLSDYLGVSGAGYSDGKGWMPLGYYQEDDNGRVLEDCPFQGVFDGDGHTITGFYMNRTLSSDPYAYNSGFFGYVGGNAKISDLGIVCNKTNGVSFVRFSGGFVGWNCGGSISNCWADINVRAPYNAGGSYVGAFAGVNNGSIEYCYSLGSVDIDYSSASVEEEEFPPSKAYSFAGTQTRSPAGTSSHCYAVQTKNYVFSDNDYDETNLVFSDIDEMVAHGFNDFDNGHWIVAAGELPMLIVGS